VLFRSGERTSIVSYRMNRPDLANFSNKLYFDFVIFGIDPHPEAIGP